MTVGPNPFSREGSRPGDGLGEINRFETLADGSTPRAEAAPAEPRPAPPQPNPEQNFYPDQNFSPASGPAFPSYPYAEQAPVRLSPGPPQFGAPQPYLSGPAGYPLTQRAGYPYGPILQNSPYATVALITGIIGVFCGITGPLAIGFAVAALQQIRREPRVYGGQGLAIGGLITGALGSLFLTYYIVLAVSV